MNRTKSWGAFWNWWHMNWEWRMNRRQRRGGEGAAHCERAPARNSGTCIVDSWEKVVCGRDSRRKGGKDYLLCIITGTDILRILSMREKEQNLNFKDHLGFPWWLSGEESTCQCRRHGFDPWSGKIPIYIRATKLMHHRYWACALEPGSSNDWAPSPLGPCSATREATTMRSPHIAITE